MFVLVNAFASCQKLKYENLSVEEQIEDMRLFIEQERASIAQYKETIDLLNAQMARRHSEMPRRDFEPWETDVNSMQVSPFLSPYLQY